ncbi:MAG: hypothetical protein H7235_03480 [Bdellovibrionaceae bacterium]|nr:hypothetical protein [Pseudobdellovibrionaceae bacterium]
MKKIILGLVLGLTAVTAHASVQDPGTRYTTRYECSFTEPFIQVNYDTYSKKMNVSDMGKQIKSVSGVSMKAVAGSTDVNVVDKASKTILTLRNEVGSDGMSDKEYMLTGIYEGNVGGCDATFKKITD